MTRSGERVGCILSMDSEQCLFLGYGVYLGDEVPPYPVGMIRAVSGCKTWEEFEEKTIASLGRPPENHVHIKNPLILLDDGETVWGAEIWFGPEERIRESLAGHPNVVQADINEARKRLDEEIA